jgi:hypothetical protein
MLVGGELKDSEADETRDTAWFVLVTKLVGGEMKDRGADGTRETG